MSLWEECQKYLVWDGSLRDLYIQNTTIEDWKKFIHWIKESQYEWIYEYNGQIMEIPSDAASIFHTSEPRLSSLLSIRVSRMQLNCHFFRLGDIEIDLDPREVSDEGEFLLLLKFMQNLANTVNRNIIITHENLPQSVFLRYDSRLQQFQFIPPDQ